MFISFHVRFVSYVYISFAIAHCEILLQIIHFPLIIMFRILYLKMKILHLLFRSAYNALFWTFASSTIASCNTSYPYVLTLSPFSFCCNYHILQQMTLSLSWYTSIMHNYYAYVIQLIMYF